MTILPLTAVREHCVRKTICEEELKDNMTYDQMCQCHEAVALRLLMDLDCSLWKNCLEKHTDLVFFEVFLQLNEAFKGKYQPHSLLLQQTSGRQNPVNNSFNESNCTNPYYVNIEELQCNCWASMRLHCTQNGAISLSSDDMYKCMNELLCCSGDVCSGWKADQCSDVVCKDTSLLAVYNMGDAEQVTPSSLTETLQVRRQPPNSSSSEELLLETSVGCKAGAASAR